MGSDLTFKPTFIKKPVSLEIEREKPPDTESKNGAILFDKKSGVHLVVSLGFAAHQYVKSFMFPMAVAWKH